VTLTNPSFSFIASVLLTQQYCLQFNIIDLLKTTLSDENCEVSLRSTSDIDNYAAAVKQTTVRTKIAPASGRVLNESFNATMRKSTRDFYRTLRGFLGQ
jgi:hypothetical protein